MTSIAIDPVKADFFLVNICVCEGEYYICGHSFLKVVIIIIIICLLYTS